MYIYSCNTTLVPEMIKQNTCPCGGRFFVQADGIAEGTERRFLADLTAVAVVHPMDDQQLPLPRLSAASYLQSRFVICF